MLKRSKRISLVSSEMYRQLNAALFLVVIGLCPFAANAQSLQNSAAQIRAAVDTRDFERAERLVDGIRKDHPAEFVVNNYDFLLARLLERRGVTGEAGQLYEQVLARKGTLAQYALWHLAVISRNAGDLAAERQYLTRLLVAYPQSALAAKARDRIIDSHMESRDFRTAVSLLKPQASITGARGRNAMARLGMAYSNLGDREAARGLFNQLVNGGSRDDYALIAAQGLDELDKAAAVRPNEFDELRRARIYLFNRHWAEARSQLEDLINRFPQSPNLAEAQYQTGFTYFREYRHDDAIKWFERVHAEFPEKKEGEQGYYWVGSSLQQAKRYEEAARRYIDFSNAYPKSDLLEGAYRNVVDCLRYAGKFDEAVEWARKTTQRFAKQPLATVGLYNEAKIELTRGNYTRALELLTRISAQPVHARVISAPIRGEAAFLRIFTLEKMKRIGEAVRAYLAIPDERDNYFGQRATERLRAIAARDEGKTYIEPLAREYRTQAKSALAQGRYAEAKDAIGQALRLIEDEDVRRDLLASLRTCYAHLPAYEAASRYRLMTVGRELRTARSDEASQGEGDLSHQSIAKELMFLGLYDDGVGELILAGVAAASAAATADAKSDGSVEQTSASATGDAAYSLAVYSNRGDQAYRAIAFGESAAKAIPQDYRVELMPRDLAELIYPAPYRDVFEQYAPRAGVDPRLVLSLARQESRFNPGVKSAAAARGLLQFIPETALKLAEEEGMKSFELDDVYEPKIAVRLAVRYVADLLKLFPDNPHAVLAAYNTGEQNVERWIARARTDDVDRLVTEIAIPETKDYVAKVMNSYRAYVELYTRDLKPKN
jgi:soluble lytic murein transglycosylase